MAFAQAQFHSILPWSCSLGAVSPRLRPRLGSVHDSTVGHTAEHLRQVMTFFAYFKVVHYAVTKAILKLAWCGLKPMCRAPLKMCALLKPGTMPHRCPFGLVQVVMGTCAGELRIFPMPSSAQWWLSICQVRAVRFGNLSAKIIVYSLRIPQLELYSLSFKCVPFTFTGHLFGGIKHIARRMKQLICPKKSQPNNSLGHAEIQQGQLKLDAHALANIFTCKTRNFDGYVQALNPDFKFALTFAVSSCSDILQ